MDYTKYSDMRRVLLQQGKSHYEIEIGNTIKSAFFADAKAYLGIINYPKADTLLEIAWEMCYENGTDDMSFEDGFIAVYDTAKKLLPLIA